MKITPRIGFCCKFETEDKVLKASMNQSSTTLKALRALTREDAYTKLYGLVEHNIQTLHRQLKWIAAQPEALRLFRIGSDFLPAYTAQGFDWVYADADMQKLIQTSLAPVRPFCEENGIRLCTHPGQFTLLCSQKTEVVDNSIEDLNYHVYLAQSMGYGDSWHSGGFAINIHANNNLDPGLERLKDIFNNRLSPTLRNLLTIENDEFGCSVDEIISAKLYDHIALVLDIHHHWVESRGQYIQPSDPRIQYFQDSWRGVRPLGHFSTSSEELLKGSCSLAQPNYTLLEGSGHKPSKLRAHSYGCWNQGSNDWALSHLSWTDLEVEAKGKQVASRQLWERGTAIGLF